MSQCAQRQGCQLERPKEVEGINQQESQEIQEKQMHSPDLGLNNLV